MSRWRDRLTDAANTVQQDLVHDGDHLTLHSHQDVGPVLDDNQRRRSMGPNNKAQGFILAGVPNVLYYVQWPEEFRQRYGWHPNRPPPDIKPLEAKKMYRDWFIKKIHHRDYRKLKTDDRSII